MKKLYILILILFIGCSKDSIYEPEEIFCNCKVVTYQVTINGKHIVRNELDIKTKCINKDVIFGKEYSNNRLIQYKKYVCD